MTSADDVKKMIVAISVAAIMGAWTFAGSRASSQDIADVRDEIKEVEAEAKERHVELAAKVDEINDSIQAEAVEAAAFRAQVRAALEIRERH
jgi:hypothetical protein